MRYKIHILSESVPSSAAMHLAEDTLASELLGCSVHIQRHPNGAPYIEAIPEVSVSITHHRNVVAVAVDSEGRIGIDLEENRPNMAEIVDRVTVLDDPDMVALYRTKADGDLRIWTAKEAAFKAAYGLYDSIVTTPLPHPDSLTICYTEQGLLTLYRI